jgi:hypothetical protein
VHNTSGSKLNVRAHEARWIGLDVDAKAHRVFWPGMGNVTIERNIYFGSSAALEGEEEESPGAGNELAADPITPTTQIPTDQPDQPDPPALAEIDESDDEDDEPEQLKPPVPAVPLRRSSRNRKPSHIIWDLQTGEGTAPTHHAPSQIIPPP